MICKLGFLDSWGFFSCLGFLSLLSLFMQHYPFSNKLSFLTLNSSVRLNSFLHSAMKSIHAWLPQLGGICPVLHQRYICVYSGVSNPSTHCQDPSAPDEKQSGKIVGSEITRILEFEFTIRQAILGRCNFSQIRSLRM